jgi:hypothetical protein
MNDLHLREGEAKCKFKNRRMNSEYFIMINDSFTVIHKNIKPEKI